MQQVEDSDVQGFRTREDDQIQQRLLEADDEIFYKEILKKQILVNQRQKNGVNSNVNALLSYVTNSSGEDAKLQKLLREFQLAPFSGWNVETDVVYRKTPSDSSPPKSKGTTRAASKERTTISRDSKNKSYPSEDFVFRHYTDRKQYIEQYRKRHTCYESLSLPVTRNEILASQKPNVYGEYSPLAFSQFDSFQQNTSVPSSLQEKSFVHNVERQNKAPYTLQQIPTVYYPNTQEQHTQAAHVKSQSAKKSYSPSISEKYFSVPESTHARGNSEKTVKAKNVKDPAVSDISLQRIEATMMKLHVSNINFMPTKDVKFQLAAPGPPLDVVTGSELTGPRHHCGSSRQPRVLDIPLYSAGNRTEKEKSGIKEVASNAAAQSCIISKCDPRSKPCQLSMTHTHKGGGGWSQTPYRADVSKSELMLRTLPVRNGDDLISSNIEENSLCSSDHKKTDSNSTLGSERISDQQLPRKEKSMLAVTGHDFLKSKKCVFNHWTLAEEQDSKSMLSHNRRIRHLIEQSKLKCKFDKILNLSKTQPSRNLLEINSIQITDPFVKAVPRNRNSNNSDLCEHNVPFGSCSCCTDFKISNNLQKGGPAFGGEASAASFLNRMGEFYYLTTNGGFSTTCVEKGQHGCYKNQVNERELIRSQIKEAGLINGKLNEADLINQSLYGHSQQHSGSSKTDMCQDSNKIIKDMTLENALDNYLPREDNLLQTSVNKGYIQKLAEEVSTLVKSTVPKIRYSKYPLVCRSQSLDL